MQLTQAKLDAALGDLIATGATFDPAAVFLGVATAIEPGGLATLLSDLTQATGAMATRQAVTAWGDTMHLVDGSSAVEGPLMTFAPASSSESQTLVAWFLADALTAGNLIAYGLIDPAVPLPDQYNSWNIVLRLTLDPNGQWDASNSWNG